MRTFIKEHPATFEKLLCGCLVAAFCVGLIVFRSATGLVVVKGNSMNNTLSNGDLLVTIPADTIHRGDIVVADTMIPPQPGDAEKEATRLVKRVVAVPGDVVSSSDGMLSVNGKAIEGCRYYAKTIGTVTQTLGKDEYFLVGDNYDDSYDSRSFGTVKKNEITRIVKRKLWQ